MTTKRVNVNDKAIPTMARTLLKSTGMFLLLSFLMVAAGCMSTMTAKGPHYERVDLDTEASVLVLNKEFSSFWANRYTVVKVDGYAVSDKLYLPKGQTTLKLDPGSHQLSILLKKRSADIQALPREPLTFTFPTEAGKSYEITIGKKTSLMAVGLKLSYSGWSEDVAARFPRQFP